mmetsp:Transcript_1941/g.3630  ORF Transcript_1941/g.3630 Transcript_1941/m.3630 type:complete len:226 (-) Transcript_1941:1060-1737(-)
MLGGDAEAAAAAAVENDWFDFHVHVHVHARVLVLVVDNHDDAWFVFCGKTCISFPTLPRKQSCHGVHRLAIPFATKPSFEAPPSCRSLSPIHLPETNRPHRRRRRRRHRRRCCGPRRFSWIPNDRSIDQRLLFVVLCSVALHTVHTHQAARGICYFFRAMRAIANRATCPPSNERQDKATPSDRMDESQASPYRTAPYRTTSTITPHHTTPHIIEFAGVHCESVL